MLTTKDLLRDLIAERAIVESPFSLSNGSVSLYYFDCKRLTLSSDGAWAVGEAVIDVLERLPERPVALGGLTHGADPIVGAAMMCARQRGWKLDGFYVRQAPKTHGTQNRIENVPPPNVPVVIVDDVITSGKSVMDAIECTEEAGCRIVAVIAVVDRLEGGTERIRKRVPNAVYRPLYVLNDFPEIERIKRQCTTISEPRCCATSLL